MIADIMTKALSQATYEMHTAAMEIITKIEANGTLPEGVCYNIC